MVGRHSPAVVTALAAGFGALFLLPLAWLVDGPPTWPGWPAVGALGLLALGASAAANLAWWHVAARLPANRAAIFILLVPVVGAAAGALFLGDPLTPIALAGAGLVLAGIYLAEVAEDSTS